MGLLCSGCSELVIKENDDGSAIIGKVAYRTVFAVLTLGYSEVKIHEANQEYEREQQLKAFEARVMEFLNNGEITKAQADEMIRKEKERLRSEKDHKD
ncbi:MAG: hypothetical protein JSU59_11935 [Nitrospirota bacterium]|nr:MAG: hypothetical protein JSU59_11935 [Nitrospirota bacterium]